MSSVAFESAAPARPKARTPARLLPLVVTLVYVMEIAMFA
jgi:hypothetical protein